MDLSIKTEPYEIILLVIASRNTIYDQMVRHYWKPFIQYTERLKQQQSNVKPTKESTNQVKIFLLYGTKQSNKESLFEGIRENILICPTINTESLVPGILQKTVWGFEHIHKTYTYNKILRTNLSSFFILNNLIKQSNTLPNQNLYAGFVTKHIDLLIPNLTISVKRKDVFFCSGAGFWCSKNIIEHIIKNAQQLNYTLPDDVSIGVFLGNAYMKHTRRFDIIYNINMNYESKKALLKKASDNNHYHIRIKNEANRNIDIEYMKCFAHTLYLQ